MLVYEKLWVGSGALRARQTDPLFGFCQDDGLHGLETLGKCLLNFRL